MANEVAPIPSPPVLPGFGMQDGDQIMDSNGNIFEYSAEQDTWVYRGQIEVPDTVTRDSEGLVYPSIYRKLELIQELIDRGIDFGVFKLDTPGETPYYYFFYSSDDLIRFYPESGSRLRMELDRGRLYQKLLRTCCAGPKGQQGIQGDAGRAGVSADNEKFFGPTVVTSGSFEFETTVDTPIDTEISLRLFRGDQILVEYLIAIETGSEIVSVGGATRNLSEDEKAAAELEFEARGDAAEGKIDDAVDKLQQILDLGIETVDSENIQAMIDSLEVNGTLPESTNPLTIIIYDDNIDVSITGTEIHFDHDTNRLWGTLGFTSGDSDIASWKYKTRQRGPKGTQGDDGSPFLEVLSQTIGDPSVQSGSAVITVRKSDLTNNLFFLNGTLPDDVCVSNLAISASTLPLDPILAIKYVAAKITTRRCKDIGSYQYNQPEYTPPELELPAWEPTPDCVSAARYSSYKFEWWDSSDPKYPYRIVTPPRPEETCCQEPFFWCPNVGDNPCGVNHWRCGGIEKLPSGVADAQGISCDGEAREPILKAPNPHPPDCNCDCDSPIAFELQDGGFLLGTVVLGPDGEDTNSIAEYSVIDGRTDIYKANFRSKGPIEIVVSLDWKPQVCGGETIEEENCQYSDDCEVHTTVVFEDKNQNAEIDGGGVSDLSVVPGSMTFNVRPLSGDEIDININVMVNDTRSQCCRGYQIMMISQYKGTNINQGQAGNQAGVQVVDVDWVGP